MMPFVTRKAAALTFALTLFLLYLTPACSGTDTGGGVAADTVELASWGEVRDVETGAEASPEPQGEIQDASEALDAETETPSDIQEASDAPEEGLSDLPDGLETPEEVLSPETRCPRRDCRSVQTHNGFPA
jgi:hypothetical protein